MNIAVARHLVEAIAQLTELTARFQAVYGKNYRLKPASPTEAWTLYHAIQNQQRCIAGYLDASALEQRQPRRERWWETHDVMDTAITQELFLEAHQLLARCVYGDATGHLSPGIACSQAVIAGMLHPVAIQDPQRNLHVA